MLCNYGGNAESINTYYKGDIRVLCKQILEELYNNTSLTSCNLGLFKFDIEQHNLEEIITAHPTLKMISIHSGEKQKSPPLCLYKKSNGGCVWSETFQN